MALGRLSPAGPAGGGRVALEVNRLKDAPYENHEFKPKGTANRPNS